MLSLTVKKLDAFKFDGVTKSDNSDLHEVRANQRDAVVPCRLTTVELSFE